MPIDDPCLAQNLGRRRIFWTTRPEVCGEYNTCGVTCSIPGLEYDDNDPAGRTIRTEEWLTGLILNILNTRARTDQKCSNPAATFGHWSESYRDDNLYIGSTLWNAAEKNYTRVNDAVRAIGAAIKADLGKLIRLGVADRVEVATNYRGGMRVDVAISVWYRLIKREINMSGIYATDGWVWR